MKTVAAIGSRPIRAQHSSHVHASFLYGIELCCIRWKKLVQETSCTRNHVRRSSFLYKSTCTSFLCKFLDCVSPPLQLSCERTWPRIFGPHCTLAGESVAAESRSTRAPETSVRVAAVCVLVTPSIVHLTLVHVCKQSSMNIQIKLNYVMYKKT